MKSCIKYGKQALENKAICVSFLNENETFSKKSCLKSTKFEWNGWKI